MVNTRKAFGMLALMVSLAGLSVSTPVVGRDFKTENKDPNGTYDKDGWPVQTPGAAQEKWYCKLHSENHCGFLGCEDTNTHVCPNSVLYQYRKFDAVRLYGVCTQGTDPAFKCPSYTPMYCAHGWAYRNKAVTNACEQPKCQYFRTDTTGCLEPVQ